TAGEREQEEARQPVAELVLEAVVGSLPLVGDGGTVGEEQRRSALRLRRQDIHRSSSGIGASRGRRIPGRRETQASPSRRASKAPDQSSSWNWAIVAAVSSSNRCCTTPTSRSFTNGTSTCPGETRLTETFPHAGQRTARPTRSPLAAGASSLKADGNTGRGLSSGQQKKLHGHSPAPIREAARSPS